MLDEERDVFAALAQGGDRELCDGEAVEEVGAKRAAVDLGREIAVRRGDDADVGGDDLRRAETADLAGLDGAQELGLDVEWELADLVAEERATVCGFEHAHRGFAGAGECALLVAEDLIFEELLGDRGAVEHDERTVAARRALVDGVGDAFLARAGFALDEDGRVGLREAIDEIEEVAHRRTAADQAVQTGFVPQRDADGLVERIEDDGGLADLDRGARRDEAVDDADAANVSAVRRAEVAHAVAVALQAQLAVEAGDLRIGEVQVGAGAADHVSVISFLEEQLIAIAEGISRSRSGALLASDGNGKRESAHDGVASRLLADATSGDELGERRRDGRVAEAAELAKRGRGQRRSRFRESGFDDLDGRRSRCGGEVGFGRSHDVIDRGQRDCIVVDSEPHGHGRDGCSGAVFGGECQLLAVTAQVEIGIAPRVEFARATQGLTSAHFAAALSRMVHEHDGEAKSTLQLAQIREERRDLTRDVLVDAVQADERI